MPCGLPFRSLVLGLGKFRDVVAGALKRDQFATVTRLYRFVEGSFPTAIRHAAANRGARLRAAFEPAAFFCHPTPGDRGIP